MAVLESYVKWKVTGLFKADPKKVYDEITSLEEITPAGVVELAKDESSVMHPLFEWDDRVAAGKYREHQAGTIIRNIVIETREIEGDGEEKQPVRIRAIVSDGLRENRYVTIVQAYRDVDTYQRLLNAALAELEAFRRKYSVLSSDLGEVFAEIEAVLALRSF